MSEEGECGWSRGEGNIQLAHNITEDDLRGEGQKRRGAEGMVPAPLCATAATFCCRLLYPRPATWMNVMKTNLDSMSLTCNASHTAPLCTLTLRVNNTAFHCRPLCPAPRMNC